MRFVQDDLYEMIYNGSSSKAVYLEMIREGIVQSVSFGQRAGKVSESDTQSIGLGCYRLNGKCPNGWSIL